MLLLLTAAHYGQNGNFLWRLTFSLALILVIRRYCVLHQMVIRDSRRWN